MPLSLSLGIRLLTRTRPSPTAPRPKPMCGATHSSYSRARRRSSACASRSSLYAAAKPQLPLRPEAKYRSPAGTATVSNPSAHAVLSTAVGLRWGATRPPPHAHFDTSHTFHAAGQRNTQGNTRTPLSSSHTFVWRVGRSQLSACCEAQNVITLTSTPRVSPTALWTTHASSLHLSFSLFLSITH